MSINSREDANKYYQLVNELIDKYIDGHKIRPSRLRTYLKPGGQRFNKFLERNKLKDVSGAERILRDVIEDREHMEKDGVVTFVSFTLLESTEWKVSNLKECIYKGIEKADIKMEKILADYFDINLGAIDVIDTDKHKFKIDDWKNDDWKVVVYSDEDIEVIKSNIIDYLFDEISDKKVEIIEGLSIGLKELIEEEKFNKSALEIVTESKTIEIVCKCLGEDWSFESKYSSHYIFVC